MNKIDENIGQQIFNVLTNGYKTEGKVRTKWSDGEDAHTIYISHVFDTYDLTINQFPLSSIRPTAWKKGISEILWIYQDQSNSIDLLEEKYGVMWWRDWDIGDSTIGQRYGATVKKYDLMNKLLKDLESNPNGRRHIINLYQYVDLNETSGLHPCAMETHWTITNGYLDLALIQRSQDMFVAQSINKIQYVALQMMVATHLGLKVGQFSHFVINLHIYDRHLKHLDEIVDRLEYLDNSKTKQPVLKLNVPLGTNFYDITIDDFEVINYKPVMPQLKFELAL